MSHSYVPVELRKKLGIHDNFIRLSIGIEDLDDIIEDVNNALEASAK
jgi:cystathionine gamma-lyase